MPTAPHRRPRRGLTLVEVVVALTLLATGLVGLAAIGGASLQRLDVATARETAVRLAANRLQRLVALPCGATASGSAGTVFVEEWAVSSAGSRRTFVLRVHFTVRGTPRLASVSGELAC